MKKIKADFGAVSKIAHLMSTSKGMVSDCLAGKVDSEKARRIRHMAMNDFNGRYEEDSTTINIENLVGTLVIINTDKEDTAKELEEKVMSSLLSAVKRAENLSKKDN